MRSVDVRSSLLPHARHTLVRMLQLSAASTPAWEGDANAWRGNAPSVLPRSVGSGVVGARVGLAEGFTVGGDVVGKLASCSAVFRAPSRSSTSRK